MTALGPATVKRPASDAGSWLIVAECFGVETPTFQGEGPSCGHPALFIRLSRCNLTCARCDTKYTRDWSRFDPAQGVDEAVRGGPGGLGRVLAGRAGRDHRHRGGRSAGC